MSVLATPRIHLFGSVSWDPSVANNDEQLYDLATGRVVRQQGETVEQFRLRMATTTAERGDWNLYGSHTARFEGVTVVGGLHGPGNPCGPGDALLGSDVDLVGKLVDIDPKGLNSQWFFDELAIGHAGRPHLRARPLRRMSSRWLYFRRNLDVTEELIIAGGAGAVWQAVFPRRTIELGDADGSPLLAAVAELLAARRARGIMLRLCVYRTQYFRNGFANPYPSAANPAELAARYEHGDVFPNPAYSAVVGTIGPWLTNDAQAQPGGRHLYPVGAAPVRNVDGGPVAPCGPLAVEVSSRRDQLTLDLSNTIPEIDAALGKADYGDLQLVALGASEQVSVATLRSSAYDQAAYQAGAGIVDVAVGREARRLVQRGTLELRAGPIVLAREQPLLALPDESNVYLDHDDTHAVRVRVLDRGRRSTRPVQVLVVAYDRDFANPITIDMLTVPERAGTQLEITATEVGARHMVLLPFTGETPPAPPATMNFALDGYCTVRSLPSDDDLTALDDADVTWDLVFNRVLIPYHALTPRMSNIIDLGDSDAVATFARRILAATDPELIESSRYMPVTRDLSRARRDLLHRWCRRVLADDRVVGRGRPERVDDRLRGERALAVGFLESERGARAATGAAPKLEKRALPTGED